VKFKKNIFFGYCFTVLLIIAVLALTKNHKSNSKFLGINPEVLVFDRVWDNQTYEKHISVQNLTQKKIEILEVVTNCSCVVGTVDNNELQPNGTTTLRISFSAPATFLPITDKKEVLIKTNQGIVSLPVTINILPRIEASKMAFDIGLLKTAEEKNISVVIENHTKEAWNPKVIDIPIGVKTNIEPLSGNRIRIDILLTRNALISEIWDGEIIKIDTGNGSIMNLEFTGKRDTNINVQPPVLNFGFVNWKNSKEIFLDISHKKLLENFKVKKITSDSTEVQIANIENTVKGHYRVQVKYINAADTTNVGNISKKSLTIITNDPEQSEYIIPIISVTPKINPCCP
jgi:hypothetical protein